MAQWKTPTGGDSIIDALPNLDTVTEGLGEIAHDLGAVAEVLGVLDALASLQDPLSTILSVGVQQFQDFLANLLDADVFMLPIAPITWGDLLRPYTIEQAINDLSASTNDSRDGSRPVFNDRNAFASFTIVLGANNWMDFERALKIFSKLFDGSEFNKWKKLADISFRRNELTKTPFPRLDRNAQGVPWDWTRTNWENIIPGVASALHALASMLDTLTGIGRGIADGVQDLISALQERVQYIKSVLEQLSAIAQLLAEWKELFPRLRYVFTSGDDGGTNGYLQSIDAATHRPAFKLTAGVTFVAFGPNALEYMDAMRRLIGLQMVEVDAALEQAQAALNPQEQP